MQSVLSNLNLSYTCRLTILYWSKICHKLIHFLFHLSDFLYSVRAWAKESGLADKLRAGKGVKDLEISFCPGEGWLAARYIFEDLDDVRIWSYIQIVDCFRVFPFNKLLFYFADACLLKWSPTWGVKGTPHDTFYIANVYLLSKFISQLHTGYLGWCTTFRYQSPTTRIQRILSSRSLIIISCISALQDIFLSTRTSTLHIYFVLSIFPP